MGRRRFGDARRQGAARHLVPVRGELGDHPEPREIGQCREHRRELDVIASWLRERLDGASVIIITSAVDDNGFQNLTVYSAAKAAARNLARTFAAKLAPRGIRVNALSPGAIETPLF